MARNNEYWRQRFQQLEEARHKDVQSLLPDIDRIYKQAQTDIETKIRAWYQRLADNNGVSMAEARKLLSKNELEEFKWTVEEYIKRGKENARDQRWMKELENASAKFHINRLEALKLQVQQSLEVVYGNQLDQLDTSMRGLYQEGYYRTAFELQKGFRIGFPVAAVDQNKLDKIIKKPWAPDGKNFSDRIWQNKAKLVNEVHTELTRMCITGAAPDAAIRNIAKKMQTSRYNAGRLVMTEAAYFGSVSQKDCFNDLNVEQYEICATLDSHTSELCQSLDGKVFAMKDYEAGVTAPPFHVFCRTCTVPYFDDEFTAGELRAARGADGKTYYVPADMKYPEWRKQFAGTQKSGIIKTAKSKTSSEISDQSKSGTNLKQVIEDFIDGTNPDRETLGKQILEDYHVNGVPVYVKGMPDYGYCRVKDNDGILEVIDYNLNENDKRSAIHQVKTAFHEAYHASGNGYATDYRKMDASRWLDLEETFAESTAHYMMQKYGITDIAPSYPEKLVKMLPRLKKLPEFSGCRTISDFGKVAQELRQQGGGSVWKSLSQSTMRKKFDFGSYTKQYFSEIRKDIPGYVDKILENMPGSIKSRNDMIADLEKAMKHIEVHGFTLSDNESFMLNNAVAVAMNRMGVK